MYKEIILRCLLTLFFSVSTLAGNSVLAQEKVAIVHVAASKTSGGASFSPFKTIDSIEDPSNSWKSWSNDPVSITYELADIENINSLDVLWYGNTKRSYRFSIQISEDESDWVTVVELEQSSKMVSQSDYEQYSFIPTQGKFLRIVAYGNDLDPSTRIIEVGISAVAGSQEPDPEPEPEPEPGLDPSSLSIQAVSANRDDGNIASNTIDGSFNSRWSASGDGSFITFDLGQSARMDQVNIAFYKGDLRKAYFDILTSSDGINFQQQVNNLESSGQSTAFEVFDVGSVDAQYLRIVGHGNSVNAWNSLTEVEVIGLRTDNAPNEPDPDPDPDPTNPTPVEPGDTSNIIPASRRIEWSAGIPGGIPYYATISQNVNNHGAIANDGKDDTQAFINAIDSASTGSVVFVPDGTYNLSKKISITKSIVLRGNGADKTRLIFNTSDSLIEFTTNGGESWKGISGNLDKGSNIISASDATGIQAGDFIMIRQHNDPAVIKYAREWATHAVGQVLKIKDVSGDDLHLEKPLYYSYKASMNPQFTYRKMLTGAGLENIYIEKTNGDGASRSITFFKAAHCWVQGVRSEKTDKAHIEFRHAYGNEVRSSFFNSAHDHGAGGQAYGTRFERYASDNLIIDNVFKHLRHSMVLQLGASGNIHAYNYSLDPYTSQSPSWLTSDITIHGSYPYMNLFEGNVVQHIISDDIHGTNGPNTFFRNRVEKNAETITASITKPERFGFIEIHENNLFSNIIGNELGNRFSFPTDTAIKVNHPDENIVHGNFNYTTQSIEWDQEIEYGEMPSSLFLQSKPSFFGDMVWPIFYGSEGPVIPAQQRYENELKDNL